MKWNGSLCVLIAVLGVYPLAFQHMCVDEGDELQSTEVEDVVIGLDQVDTLYARDPVTSQFCLSTGLHSVVFRSGELRGRGSQIEFGQVGDSVLSAFGSGGDRSTLLNLGALEQNGGAAFLGLRRDGDLIYLQGAGASAGAVFEAAIPDFAPSLQAVGVSAGDICILRIENVSMAGGGYSVGDTAYYKLHALEVLSGQSFTFRWLEF